jgi:hypothetical protein
MGGGRLLPGSSAVHSEVKEQVLLLLHLLVEFDHPEADIVLIRSCTDAV